MKKPLFLIFSITLLTACIAVKKSTYQPTKASKSDTYWQQHISYAMDIDVAVEKH